uniref:Uncharacterized protein n=1 Tax=Rhizophora mucronata TaxID=61149 RepID=A0A2P2QBQ1_RHIMU
MLKLPSLSSLPLARITNLLVMTWIVSLPNTGEKSDCQVQTTLSPDLWSFGQARLKS